MDLRLAFVHWSLVPEQLLAVAAILFLSLANYFGLKAGTIIQNIFTFVRLACAALFIIGGLAAVGRFSDGPNVSRFFQGTGSFGWTGFGLALIAMLWAYDGWYSVSCAAEEVKNPKRNIPLSLILGTLILPWLFVAINLAVFANRIIAQAKESLGGALILIIGIPAYFYWRAKSRKSSPGRQAEAQPDINRN